MELSELTISVTSKSAIRGILNPERFDVPPFFLGDRFRGSLIVVKETNNPNAPTEGIDDLTDASVALTNGDGVIYCRATNFDFDANTCVYSLSIAGDTIEALLDVVGKVEAYLEIRVRTITQEETVLRELVPIYRSEDEIEDINPTLTFTDSGTIHWSLA